jgi:hypothetical protein
MLVLLTDGFMVLVLFRLRARSAAAPFRVPWYPLLPSVFLGVYVLLFVATALEQPMLVGLTGIALALTYLVGVAATGERKGGPGGPPSTSRGNGGPL